jgi:hypothetical protein
MVNQDWELHEMPVGGEGGHDKAWSWAGSQSYLSPGCQYMVGF